MTSTPLRGEATVITHEPGVAERHAPSRRELIVNNTVALVLGGMIMVFLHESAHWVSGALTGHRSLMYSFGVDQGTATGGDAAITAMAGPVFSLALGYLMSVVQPLRGRANFAHLLWVWVAFTSMTEGVAYLVITPFGAGDTAFTMKALQLPIWVAFVACAIGVAGMLWVTRRFAPVAREIAGPTITRIRATTIWPWLFAALSNMVLSVVSMSIANLKATLGEQIIIIVAGVATSVFAPMAIGRAVRLERPTLPMRLRSIPVAGLVGIAVMIGVWFLMRNGVPLGG